MNGQRRRSDSIGTFTTGVSQPPGEWEIWGYVFWPTAADPQAVGLLLMTDDTGEPVAANTDPERLRRVAELVESGEKPSGHRFAPHEVIEVFYRWPALWDSDDEAACQSFYEQSAQGRSWRELHAAWAPA
jgi:hypothetical protein